MALAIVLEVVPITLVSEAAVCASRCISAHCTVVTRETLLNVKWIIHEIRFTSMCGRFQLCCTCILYV